MVSIVFYTKDHKGNQDGSGSGFMRLNQIADVIKKKNTLENSQIIMTTDIRNVHNSYIIFCKDNYWSSNDTLSMAKQNKNTVIFDVLDYYDVTTSRTPDMIRNGVAEYIDVFIVNNEFMKREFEKKFNKPTFVVYHHYDVRLNDIVLKKRKDLTFIFNGYIGDKQRNCLYIHEMTRDFGLVVNEPFLHFYRNMLASNYCFVSIRQEGSWEYENRPLMKLAHAAACDSNIVITNDMSVRDLLDPSYPYLLKDSKYETVVEMMEYVKKTFETDVWYNGLAMMKDLKHKLKIEQVVDDYWVPTLKEIQNIA